MSHPLYILRGCFISSYHGGATFRDRVRRYVFNFLQYFLKTKILPEALRYRERKSFIQDGQESQYDIYDASGPPPNIFGRVGDVAQDGERVWFRGNYKWEISSQEIDHLGRPLQKHPVFKSNRRLEGLEWKSQATWNARKRKRHDLNGTRLCC